MGGPEQLENRFVYKEGTDIKKKGAKTKSIIVFDKEYDFSCLDHKVETVMSKESILERRKNKNVLPDDFSYEIKDLYRFNIRDGFFAVKTKEVFSTNNGNETELQNNTAILDVNVDNGFDMDNLDGEISFQMEQSLVLNDQIDVEPKDVQLKFTRVAKMVDIKKLKENVQNSINMRKNSILEISDNIPTYYQPKESKDISIHFCLISLLHLANEQGLELQNVGNDIVIKRS